MVEKRGMRAEDLQELKSVKNPELSPDGTRFVFVQTVINKEKHEYNSHLFVGNLQEGTIEQWTFGDVRDSSPKWSPDGKAIVFVSNRSGKSQLHLLQTSGGEARKLTNCNHGVTNPVWSPDGKKILFATSIKPNDKMNANENEVMCKEKKWIRKNLNLWLLREFVTNLIQLDF